MLNKTRSWLAMLICFVLMVSAFLMGVGTLKIWMPIAVACFYSSGAMAIIFTVTVYCLLLEYDL